MTTTHPESYCMHLPMDLVFIEVPTDNKIHTKESPTTDIRSEILVVDDDREKKDPRSIDKSPRRREHLFFEEDSDCVKLTGFSGLPFFVNPLDAVLTLSSQGEKNREIVHHRGKYIIKPKRGDFLVWSSRKYKDSKHTLYVLGDDKHDDNAVLVARYNSGRLPYTKKDLNKCLGKPKSLNIRKLTVAVQCGSYTYGRYPCYE